MANQQGGSELGLWKAQALESLPNGDVTIVFNGAALPPTYQITISWNEPGETPTYIINIPVRLL